MKTFKPLIFKNATCRNNGRIENLDGEIHVCRKLYNKRKGAKIRRATVQPDSATRHITRFLKIHYGEKEFSKKFKRFLQSVKVIKQNLAIEKTTSRGLTVKNRANLQWCSEQTRRLLFFIQNTATKGCGQSQKSYYDHILHSPNKHWSEVLNEVHYVFLAEVVLELQVRNANFHTKMDFFGSFKFEGS